MPLDFSAYPNADDATKERTEEFFNLVGKKGTTDAALREMVQEGICLEAWSDNGKRALGCASSYGRTETVQALLAAGAIVDARDKDGSPALYFAVANGETGIMQTLLAAGANIEARNKFADTALICAVRGRYIGTVRALLAAGANIEIQDKWGKSALNIAEIDELKELLLPTEWRASYADFVANGIAPKSAAEVYHLLAVTPLVDPCAPVDHAGNIQKIFAHARWPDKEQASGILTQMQRVGSINAEAVDSILHNIFHERTHIARLQRSDSVRAL